MMLILCLLSIVTSLHQDYIDRINNDLSYFQNGVTQQMMERASKYDQICVLQIKDHALIKPQCFVQPAHMELFQKIANDLPDIKFAINNFDEPRVPKRQCNGNADWKVCGCDKNYQPDMSHGFFIGPVHNAPIMEMLPIFSGGTIKECFLDILMPSYYHLEFGNYRPKYIPWGKKRFQAAWRGTSTGGWWTNQWSRFDIYHRQKLVQLCRSLAHCNAEFSDYYNCQPQICQQMFQRYGEPSFMSMDDQFRRKVVIDIDGNTFSRRFPYFLLSGSAVFKIAVFEDIGTLLVKPWEHYVPVRMDLTDFEEKLMWAKENDEELQKIAKRGKKIAKKEITMTSYKCYMTQLLRSYGQLWELGQKDSRQQQDRIEADQRYLQRSGQ